jgi:hypothetical protein
VIRVVPTGDLGLDVLTGGGWRLVKRFEGRESASIVVRGGAGAGKTLMGIHVALELAAAMNGDVAVGGVEILPTEYIAQLQSARPSLDASRIVQLPADAVSAEGPRVFVGLLTALDPDEPDLVTNLEALGEAVVAAGGKPVVFLVDSLIDGYGIGSSIDRIDADAVIKFAVEGGYGLVLCEETATDESSPWAFATDTVVQLGVEARERGRWIEVRKHRFGLSATGRHELDLGGERHPEVYPEPHAWGVLRRGMTNRLADRRSLLSSHGWRYPTAPQYSPLVWTDPSGGLNPMEGPLVFISAHGADVAEGLAHTIRAQTALSERDLQIEMDPLARERLGGFGAEYDLYFVPTGIGAARALRSLVECVGETFENASPAVGRVVLGDLALVLSAADAASWVEAVRMFATVVEETGWGIPVITYASRKSDDGAARARLAAEADVSIEVDGTVSLTATLNERMPRRTRQFTWVRPNPPSANPPFDEVPSPYERRTMRRGNAPKP